MPFLELETLLRTDMPDIIRVDTIDRAIAATLMTVAPSSQRIYQDTYNKWVD